MFKYHDYFNAIRDSDLSTVEKAVAWCFLSHADWTTGTKSHPGTSRLAKEVSADKRTVTRAIKRLRDLGWIIQTYDGKGSNSNWSSAYSLAIPFQRDVCVATPPSTVQFQRDVCVATPPSESVSMGRVRPYPRDTSAPTSTHNLLLYNIDIDKGKDTSAPLKSAGSLNSSVSEESSSPRVASGEAASIETSAPKSSRSGQARASAGVASDTHEPPVSKDAYTLPSCQVCGFQPATNEESISHWKETGHVC